MCIFLCPSGSGKLPTVRSAAVLCCAVLCCAVLCCAVPCRAVPCWAGLGWDGLGCAVRKALWMSLLKCINAAAEAVKELAQFPLEAVATGAGKRLWMSEYASGNYAVIDIRTGLDLSTQVHCSDCKHVHLFMPPAYECENYVLLLQTLQSTHRLCLSMQQRAVLLQHLLCECLLWVMASCTFQQWASPVSACTGVGRLESWQSPSLGVLAGMPTAVLCCAALCCAVLCCAVLCCAVLCCAVLCCAVLCCS